MQDAEDAFAILCRAIGPEASAKLREAAAGCLVYVPERADPLTRLAQIIGPDKCAAAIAAIGSGEIYVRSGAREAIAARDAEICIRRANGASVCEIARAFGVSAATVKRVVRAFRQR